MTFSRKVFFAAALGLAASSNVAAMTYVMPDDQTLLQQADGVLVGTVVGDPVAGPRRGLPQVQHRIAVERVLAGTLRRAEVRLELPGTPSDAALRVNIPGMPTLHAGERVLVFFNQHASGALVPRDLSLGLFFEQRDGAGQARYVRRLEGGHALNKAAADARSRARDAARFERWIRRSAAGVISSSDYYLADDSKYSLAPTGFPDGLPSRWFQFDTNQTITLRAVASGMSGATFDEFAAVSNSIAAWNNDAGSRILLAYGGTVASDQGNNSTDGVNAVIWDDPGNDISGSYICGGGGVLAIGGTYASSITGTVGGQTYHRAVEGFVITQNNAACIYNGHSGLDGAEILAHEIGHTLGFGHSCESSACTPGSAVDDALMRSYVHRDGRGARLGVDDQAVAALVYPAGSGGGSMQVFRSGFEG